MGLKVLILSPGPDNGGVGIGIKRAFDHFGDAEVRVAVRRRIWFGWDEDIIWNDRNTLVADLFARADVVHMMKSPRVVEGFKGWESKPRILHHHGAVWYAHPEYRSFRPAYAATFALVADGAGEWLPHPVCRVDVSRYRVSSAVYTVAQTPSARSVNDTELLLAAWKGLPGKLDVIEKLPWRKHLARKGRADAVFDSLGSGYGMTLAEGFGLGLPGISGSDDPRVMEAMRSELGYVPYHPVHRQTLRDDLRAFLTDGTLRAAARERGQAALSDHHDEPRIVERLTRIYREAIG